MKTNSLLAWIPYTNQSIHTLLLTCERDHKRKCVKVITMHYSSALPLSPSLSSPAHQLHQSLRCAPRGLRRTAVLPPLLPLQPLQPLVLALFPMCWTHKRSGTHTLHWRRAPDVIPLHHSLLYRAVLRGRCEAHWWLP